MKSRYNYRILALIVFLFIASRIFYSHINESKTTKEMVNDYLLKEYPALKISDSLQILNESKVGDLTIVLYKYNIGLQVLEVAIINKGQFSSISKRQYISKEQDISLSGATLFENDNKTITVIYGEIYDNNINKVELNFNNNSFIVSPQNNSLLFVTDIDIAKFTGHRILY